MLFLIRTILSIVFVMGFINSHAYTNDIPKVFKNSTFGKALRNAKHGQKKVFVFVYTDWSIPCQNMIDSTFFDEHLIHELSNDYECVAINATRKRRFANDYEVRVFPTLLVTDAAGTTILRDTGKKNSQEVIEFLEKTSSRSRFLKEDISSLLQTANIKNIRTYIDSVKYFRDDYFAKNLAKQYLDLKSTDWTLPINMYLIKEYFSLDKKYLKFISKYHFKFFERFDSTEIKENIAFHVFINSMKTNSRGRPEFNFKPVKKWFKKHRIDGVDKLENFCRIKYLLWGRGPSIKYSTNLIKDYPETTSENVLYASVIRLLLSTSRTNIDYQELIVSVKKSIKEDGTFWRYDLLSLLYYKAGFSQRAEESISTATLIATNLGEEYDPTLYHIKDHLDSIE